MKKSFRFIYRELGGHTHVCVFAGEADRQHGKCGELIMTNEEFTAFRLGLEHGSGGPDLPTVEFQAALTPAEEVRCPATLS